MNAVHNDSRTPLYQRLDDPLAQQIANIQRRSGEAIPTETPLAARVRAPIRFTPKLPDSIGIAEGYGVFAFLNAAVARGCSQA
ncbi:hypothetical protein [Pseudomonas syringae]|uniref:hypothetical protein n=1 Tax=Pseudomonas syringae TaxID=317 RepID=UPI0013C2E661